MFKKSTSHPDFTPENQDADGPERSPDLLAAPPKRGVGVRRLNKMPVLMVSGLVGASLLVLVYSMNQRASEQAHPSDPAKAAAQAGKEKPTAADQPAVLTHAPTAGIVPADDMAGLVQTAVDGEAAPQLQLTSDQHVPALSTSGGSSADAANGTPAPAVYQSPYESQWRQYDQTRAAQQQARFERANLAMSADSSVDVSKARGQDGPATAQPISAITALANAVGAAPMPASPQGDPNGLAAKRAFGAAGAGFYSSARLEAPQSRTEIKAGTVIPAVLLGGVNSELPGQLVAQVTRNVFDTTTGRYLLVPQGSKLVGDYNSDVSYGQARVQIAWKRLILPDGSSFDLGKMPGVDRGGYAGFRDKVNNHLTRTYGSALLVSMFSAGIQLSQPQAANGQNVTAGQTTAAALGQEMGQLGMEQARRNLNIKPELMIRAGYRFNVSVTEDLILKEWRAR